MIQAPTYSVVVPFRNAHFRGRNASEMRVRVLSFWDMHQARTAAVEHVAKELGVAVFAPYGQKLVNERMTVEVTALACQSVEQLPGCRPGEEPKYARVFPNGDAVMRAFTPREYQSLWDAVWSVLEPFSDVERFYDDDEVEPSGLCSEADSEALHMGTDALPTSGPGDGGAGHDGGFAYLGTVPTGAV